MDLGAFETKKAIPFKAYGTAPMFEAWNGPKEIAAADTEDLLDMCAWYDAAKPDVKASYKLPHHRQSDKKAVWFGCTAAMGAMMGARGGVQIPTAERAAVIAHLAKHYKEFGKTPPK
jgi:hypothetical protein